MKRLFSLVSIAAAALLAGCDPVYAAQVLSAYNATQPEATLCRFVFDDLASAPVDLPVVRDAAGDRCVDDITNYVAGNHRVYALYCAVDPAGIFPERCSAASNTANFTVPGAPAIAPGGLSVRK
jgi:hypothetical protein